MKKIFFILLLTPVLTEAQTTKVNNGAQGTASTVLSDNNSSLPSDNKALIVVDGVIRDSYKLQSSASLVSFGNNPGDADPAKIESVTVLNGNEAMALYGSKGTNGAIVVTTQKQKK